MVLSGNAGASMRARHADRRASFLATRSRRDQERRGYQDRHRQRGGNKQGRRFHRCPVAMRIIAGCAQKARVASKRKD
jgi:hypothetical protein